MTRLSDDDDSTFIGYPITIVNWVSWRIVNLPRSPISKSDARTLQRDEPFEWLKLEEGD